MLTGNLDNYYNRLGVSIDATQEEIKKAYFNIAKKIHPDHNQNAGSFDLFLMIQEAYNTLSSPESRNNYNKTLPDNITTPSNILINTFHSKSTIQISDKPQLIYTLINLIANPDFAILEDNHIPTQLSLVIDISTSMQGVRIEKVKALVANLLSSLSPQDRLAITIFNDHANVINHIHSKIDTNILSSKLNSIKPSGGTEVFKGLELGVSELLAYKSKNYSNQLILITDGHTYGDEDKCFELAQKAAQLNLVFHTIGIGDEWNDNFLNKLAELTGGSCSYSPEIKNLKSIIYEKIQNLQNIFAKDIKLAITSNDNATIRYAFQLLPEAHELQIFEDSIRISDLSTKNEISVLFEILIDDTSSYSEKEILNYLNGVLEFSIPSNNLYNLSIPIHFNITCSNKQNLTPPSNTIIKALRKLSLYRLESQARELLDKGLTKQAEKKLNNLATQFLSAGNEEMAKTIYLQTQILTNENELSERSKKNIKYGTKALISKEISLLKDKGD